MAGGMTPGGRENLAQRVANTQARQTGRGTQDAHGTRPAYGTAPTPATPEHASPPAVRHCWYYGPNGRQAALLLQWRNTGGHYDGHIAVATLEGDGWAIVELWVAQGMLSPV